MKLLLMVVISIVISPAAHAQGRFILSEVPALKADAAELAIRPTPVTVKAKLAAKKAPPAPDGLPDGCSSNFKKAEALFKSVHGKDVELKRIGQFSGSFQEYTSTNTLIKSGDSIFLNLSVMGGMVQTDIPVTICKRGKRLTAQLTTSLARKAGQKTVHPLVSKKIEAGTMPKSITLDIKRSKNNLIFSGKTGDTELQATAGIK